MTREQWNLIVLAAANGGSLSPVQYQKVLFLLGKALPEDSQAAFYDFQPYNYGAFDAAVYQDAESLQRQGLVEIGHAPGGWYTYAATPAGAEAAKSYRAYADPVICEYVDKLVNWARRSTFAEIVKAVYERYPETKQKSIFRD